MPRIHSQFSLKAFNSFQLDVMTDFYAKIESLEDLNTLFSSEIYQQQKKLILGGGSNLLFAKNYEGLVLHNQIQGIEVLQENEIVRLKVGGGVVWQDLVDFTLKNNWQGLENLSLIPGTVGASPVQNIGAYGVELQDVFESLTFFDLETAENHCFTKENCDFAYRQSIFKNELKGKAFITSVTFSLPQNQALNTAYGAILSVLETAKIEQPTAQDVGRAVVAIRESKLPNPTEIGNAGSFFKNPIVAAEKWTNLKAKFPEMPAYALPDGGYKIPAAWLIEQCAWRGFGRENGGAGVYEKHALILVNRGGASAADLVNLAQKIQDSVLQKYQISISPEVNII